MPVALDHPTPISSGSTLDRDAGSIASWLQAESSIIPLSGRDRRHYGNELRKAQREHERLTRAAEAAHAAADRALAEAHRLDCELWSTRLFIGGPDQPSPSIAHALHGGYELLEVQCRHCNHTQIVDLALVIWPRAAGPYDSPGALPRKVREGSREEAATGLDRLAATEGAGPVVTSSGDAVSELS